MDFSKLSFKDLQAKCKEHHISNYSGKKKQELIELLTNALRKLNVQEEIIHVSSSNVLIDANNIYQGNCLELFKSLQSSTIDMICTDPPYFLDGLGDEWNKQKLDEKGSSSVVSNLPKGMKFDRNQSKRFREFYLQVSKEAFRVLKPGGVFISFSSPRLYHSMTIAIEDAGFEIRDMLGWIYTQSQVKAFSQNHIINKDKVLTQQEKEQMIDKLKDTRTMQLKPAIEPMCLAVKPVEGRLIDNYMKYETGLMHVDKNTKVGTNNDMFPSNIMTSETFYDAIDRVFMISKPSKQEKKEYNTHLSVKPISLISHLIQLFTIENAVVLDPFMGSGTTAVACIQTKRKYIGFELNQEYIEIANKRLNDQ